MFAGVGGFRAGLTRVGGFQCVGHCEIDKYAEASYRAIHDIREEERYYPDARAIDPDDLPQFDLLCGGFPCQAFSNAGRRKGFADARGTLFFEIARLAEAKRPRYLLLENVPGLLSHDHGKTFAAILSALDDLGYHVEWTVLLPVGMLVVLDSVFNRIVRNRKLGRNTWVYIDEIYLLFQHEYSANFLFTLWKRVRKYGACCTGLTQNVDDLLQSHTARTMLANSEFLVMLNQAATDREELAKLLNISDNQLSYITNVDFGRGLIKCGSAIVPFMDNFPKNHLYKLMSTKPADLNAA